MIIHERFNLNHPTKHIFSQKYILEHCFRNSATLGYYSRKNHKSTVHFVNPYFSADPDLIHIKAHIFTQMYKLVIHISPWTVTDCPHGFQNPTSRFQALEPIKRPFKASSKPIHDLLNHSLHISPKQSVELIRTVRGSQILTFRFQGLEPIKRSFKASTNRNICKVLKRGNKTK